MEISLISPAFCNKSLAHSKNLGDLFIHDCIEEEVQSLFPNSVFHYIPTHSYPSWNDVRLVQRSQLKIVCGSNLLAFHPFRRRQWKLGWSGLWGYRDLVLMGVGWANDFVRPSKYAKFVLNSITDKKILHSVRDEFSLNMLQRCDLSNVLNTACPTMWKINNRKLKMNQLRRSENVVVTVTDYNQSPIEDCKLISMATGLYKNVIFYAQSEKDVIYIRKLGWKGSVIHGAFNILNEVIETYHGDIEYVGTRLHCGIYFLRMGFRALVLSIDNRAREISNDTGLPTCLRGDFLFVLKWIEYPGENEIRLPSEEISIFKQGILDSVR